MFGDLAKHKNIIVTGPHRSGTTIAAKMVAHDTGHDLVLEDEFSYSNIAQLAAFIQANYGPLVIQCPFLAQVIHDLDYIIDLDLNDALIVFMHRYKGDIVASEQMAVNKEFRRVAFEKVHQNRRAAFHCDSMAHGADLAVENWMHQSKVLPHAMDVSYESLRGHPLWIENRAFTLRQTDYGVRA